MVRLDSGKRKTRKNKRQTNRTRNRKVGGARYYERYLASGVKPGQINEAECINKRKCKVCFESDICPCTGNIHEWVERVLPHNEIAPCGNIGLGTHILMSPIYVAQTITSRLGNRLPNTAPNPVKVWVCRNCECQRINDEKLVNRPQQVTAEQARKIACIGSREGSTCEQYQVCPCTGLIHRWAKQDMSNNNSNTRREIWLCMDCRCRLAGKFIEVSPEGRFAEAFTEVHSKPMRPILNRTITAAPAAMALGVNPIMVLIAPLLARHLHGIIAGTRAAFTKPSSILAEINSQEEEMKTALRSYDQTKTRDEFNNLKRLVTEYKDIELAFNDIISKNDSGRSTWVMDSSPISEIRRWLDAYNSLAIRVHLDRRRHNISTSTATVTENYAAGTGL